MAKVYVVQDCWHQDVRGVFKSRRKAETFRKKECEPRPDYHHFEVNEYEVVE